MSFKVSKKDNFFKINLFTNPLARVLKFNCIQELLLKIPDGGVVLDYGSGNSPYKSFLLSKFEKYKSADYQPSHSKFKNVKPDIYINENQSLNIEAESVDCVFITEVLEHIYTPMAALSDINRVLKIDGRIIGSVPFAVGEHEIPYDYYRYTSFSLEKMLRDSGFRNIQIYKIGDEVGFFLQKLAFPFLLVEKMLRKIRLPYIGFIFRFAGSIPLYIYYLIVKRKKSIERFSRYPFGYVFYATK